MQRAEFQPLAEIFGPRIDKQITRVEPSPVAAEQFWTEIVNEADQIERLFVRIYRKLELMKRWERSGIIDMDRLDQGKEWFDLRMRALPLLLWRYGVLDDKFMDGAGI